jgi:hypothetical protein
LSFSQELPDHASSLARAQILQKRCVGGGADPIVMKRTRSHAEEKIYLVGNLPDTEGAVQAPITWTSTFLHALAFIFFWSVTATVLQVVRFRQNSSILLELSSLSRHHTVYRRSAGSSCFLKPRRGMTYIQFRQSLTSASEATVHLNPSLSVRAPRAIYSCTRAEE